MLDVGSKIGHIRIVEKLGQGGMGVVFVGYDERLGRRIAVKALRPDAAADRRLRERLLREARVLSRINHPNICEIYDVVETDEGNLLLMELVEGRNLHQALREDLAESLKMRIAIGIAEVLVATHAEGVIHRDLKPENVMLTDLGEIKVLDFGIARSAAVQSGDDLDESFESASGTHPNWVAATPLFMSPEQARQEPLTAASDLYSFGLLLQELFTGQSAYDRNLPPMRQLLRAARGETRPVEGLDSSLTSLIERLKNPTPGTRPTAVDTLQHLRDVADKPRRRRQRLLAVSAMVVLALFAVVMTVLSVRLAQSAEQLEEALRTAEANAAEAQAGRLTAEARLRFDTQFDLAVLLAVEAHRRADSRETRSILLASLEERPRLLSTTYSGTPFDDIDISPDGRLVAGALKKEVAIWELPDNRLVRRWQAHDSRIFRVAFDHPSQRLATASEDGSLRLWDARDGRQLGAPLEGGGGDVWSVAWTPDGHVLSGGHEAGGRSTIRLWDVDTGGNTIVADGEGWILVLSPDGRTLAFNKDSVTLVLQDLESGRRLVSLNTVQLGVGGLWSVAFEPNGEPLLLIGGSEGALLWDMEAQRSVCRIEGDGGTLRAVAWTVDGSRLITGSQTGKVGLWKRDCRPSIADPLGGHGEVIAADVSPDGSNLVTASAQATYARFDLSPSSRRGELVEVGEDIMTAAVWNPEGSLLATSGTDGKVRVWHDATLLPVAALDGPGEGGTWTVAWSGDGSVLAAGGENGQLQRWHTRTWEPLGQPIDAHRDEISSARTSPDGRRLVTASKDRTLRVWDFASGATVGPAFVGHVLELRDAVWLSDHRLASAGEDKVVRIWESRSGRQITDPITAHADVVNALAASLPAKLLASGGYDNLIFLWNSETLEPHGEPLVGHDGIVQALAFSLDGRYLASSGGEQKIILWDVETGREVAWLHKQRGSIFGLEWHPRKLELASVNATGNLVVRRLDGTPVAWRRRACNRVQRNLTTLEWEQFLAPEPYRPTCPELPPGNAF